MHIVPTYHANLLRRPDDHDAYEVNALNAAVLAGLAASLVGGRGRFFVTILVAGNCRYLQDRFAAGCNTSRADIRGQPTVTGRFDYGRDCKFTIIQSAINKYQTINHIFFDLLA